jgi:chorismate-pyruvate lyase
MTSRLEAFHEDSIQLEVLRVAEMDEQILEREVLLRRQRDGRVVEYGAIEIHVDIFSEGLRALITQGKLPLGGLLNHNGVSYFSEPSAFFSVVPSPVLCGLLNSREDALLYGRANVLRRSDGALIARIVEILPSCAGEC